MSLAPNRNHLFIVDSNDLLDFVDFFGSVHYHDLNISEITNDCTVYVAGDVDKFYRVVGIPSFSVFAVRNYSSGEHPYPVVDIGQVPIYVGNGAGVYFRRIFEDDNIFQKLHEAHTFQALTESNKPGSSFRSGLYLSNVISDPNQNSLSFHLLRCSTNLGGPTDNFRNVDHMIVNKVNKLAQQVFDQAAPLNHVLAQVYHNQNVNGKDKKATIKAHSDKTKDMPDNAIMAFTTFYDFQDPVSLRTDFDFLNHDSSALTRLVFKAKDSMMYPQNFEVILYPNSVFMIPLSTNRFYTHEIKASTLPIEKIPTRLGYVIRCSKTKATHLDGKTYLEDGKALEPPTAEDISILKTKYYQENVGIDVVEYDPTYFSLNQGDYIAPIL